MSIVAVVGESETGRGEGDVLVVIPPRPCRAPAGTRPVRPVVAVVRWTAAVTGLVLAGSAAALVGWVELGRPGIAAEGQRSGECVRRAVEAAEDFAAVLGDRRPVDRRAFERACAGRSGS